MTPEQEIRAAALNCVMMYLQFIATSKMAASVDILDAANTYADYITNGKKSGEPK